MAATYLANLPLIEGLTVHYELATAEKLGERGDEAANADNAPPYYSGQIDLREETWGIDPRPELGGETAAEMGEQLKQIAERSAETPVRFAVPAEASPSGEAIIIEAARLRVEEVEPGLFLFIAEDVSTEGAGDGEGGPGVLPPSPRD